MVANKISAYPNSSSPSVVEKSDGRSRPHEKKFWDPSLCSDDTFNQSDYAHHLRSSSYQLLHSRQLSSSSYPTDHCRQHSNATNYSDGDDNSTRADFVSQNLPNHSFSTADLAERSRCFSVDGGLGSDTKSHSIRKVSEPDLTISLSSPTASLSQSHEYEKGKLSPSSALPLTSKKIPSKSSKLPNSPPPPPVRDASSLKYIRYGPGHEKFPSWPVPAGASNLVLPPNFTDNLDSESLEYSDITRALLSPSQGSHRSHSWTEQSEYPKEKCAGYARPLHKRQFSPSFQRQLLTVMEKCEKIPPDVFSSNSTDELLRNSTYSLVDGYLQYPMYYPLYDREGRGIDDKDYNIPSPPERDPGMGEAHLSQMTVAQLEEHARRCDFAYGEYSFADFPQITPLLDQLRQESYTWDGASERDSGRGESEALTDSRYSNGRESVTTVVTNSSSASSSETLKWHGSLSDVSIMSTHSRDSKNDQNVVHSARVQTPQRQNSESVLYYGRGKYFSSKNYDIRFGRDGSHPRLYKDGKWTREIEKFNEVNNLKKFPSYSYTQPLSQINESPLAESRESVPTTKNPKSPVVDMSKPPSVAERITELERQVRPSNNPSFLDISTNCAKDNGELVDIQNGLPESQQKEHHNHLSENLPDCKTRKNSREFANDSFIHKSDSRSSLKSSNNVNSIKPSCVSAKHSRSFSRKDSNESMLSADSSSILSFSEHERGNSNISYTFLDPEKRCKVPDSTLKNIQKQALLSFYERRTGKSFSGSAGISPPSTSQSFSVRHPECAGRSFRSERKMPKQPVKGMARIGRVPDSDNDSAVMDRQSICGMETISDQQLLDSPSKSSEQSLDLHKRTSMNGTGTAGTTAVSSRNDMKEDLTENSDRETPLSRLSHEMASVCKSKEIPCQSLKDDILAMPPPRLSSPATDSTPIKPPDRPPKKSTMRAPFSSTSFCSEFEKDETSALTSRPYFFRKPPAPDPPASPPDTPPPFPESPLFSLVSSPLRQPEEPVPTGPAGPGTISPKHRLTLASSRSSTPELPLPPPPPESSTEGEVVTTDEPFPPPPPPSEVTSEAPAASSLGCPQPRDQVTYDEEGSTEDSVITSSLPSQLNGMYHKDSYLAHRKDWKTGYEGRYRRMHSPTAPDRNVVNGRTRERINNSINVIKSTSSQSTTPKPLLSCKHSTAPPFHLNGNLRSAVSTSSLLQHRSLSPSEVELSNGSFNNNVTISNNNLNSIHNNGWSIQHPRQKSTTVNFTADELRAFKARKAAHEASLSSSGDSNRSSPSCHSPLRPLSRTFSLGEPLHIHKIEEPSSSLSHSSSPLSEPPHPPPPLSSSSPVSHDGPVIAHPATVTEEEISSPSTSPKIIKQSSSSSNSPPPSISLSEKINLNSPLLQRTLSSPFSIAAASSSLTFHSTTNSLSSTLASSTHSSMTSLSTSSLSASTSTLVSASSSSSLLTCNASSVSNASLNASVAGHLSSIGTSPSMSPPDLSAMDDPFFDRSNVVVLSYGRTLKPEVIDCDRLSAQFILENGNVEDKLQALLAPGPEYKSIANFMNGIFSLEMRKDLLSLDHANHPDLRINSNRAVDKHNKSPSGFSTSLANVHSSVEGKDVSKSRFSERDQEASVDSFSFSASEAKAKLLSKIRNNQEGNGVEVSPCLNPHYLKRKKEELIRSINRKLEILRNEQVSVQEETRHNLDFGLKVTAKIENRAKPSEVNKFKLHAEEIDKITSLLLGLSSRLAKAENSLLLTRGKDKDSQKNLLRSKREKLSEQLEEAKKLKENIDRRAVQISRVVAQYLSLEEYADYDHFIKMKAKLIMDRREIEDRIATGEEQLQALSVSV